MVPFGRQGIEEDHSLEGVGDSRARVAKVVESGGHALNGSSGVLIRTKVHIEGFLQVLVDGDGRGLAKGGLQSSPQLLGISFCVVARLYSRVTPYQDDTNGLEALLIEASGSFRISGARDRVINIAPKSHRKQQRFHSPRPGSEVGSVKNGDEFGVRHCNDWLL